VHKRNRNLAVLLTVTIFSSSLQSVACAGVISTQEYIATIDRDVTLARIDAVLAREEVRSQLEQHGVDPVAANERIAALTDQELAQLATDLESLPAGGSSVLAVIGVVAIVLLILELVGVIDIFNKI
jgi:uncharacterized membrane protein (Fun14 family)